MCFLYELLMSFEAGSETVVDFIEKKSGVNKPSDGLLDVKVKYVSITM